MTAAAIPQRTKGRRRRGLMLPRDIRLNPVTGAQEFFGGGAPGGPGGNGGTGGGPGDAGSGSSGQGNAGGDGAPGADGAGPAGGVQGAGPSGGNRGGNSSPDTGFGRGMDAVDAVTAAQQAVGINSTPDTGYSPNHYAGVLDAREAVGLSGFDTSPTAVDLGFLGRVTQQDLALAPAALGFQLAGLKSPISPPPMSAVYGFARAAGPTLTSAIENTFGVEGSAPAEAPPSKSPGHNRGGEADLGGETDINTAAGMALKYGAPRPRYGYAGYDGMGQGGYEAAGDYRPRNPYSGAQEFYAMPKRTRRGLMPSRNPGTGAQEFASPLGFIAAGAAEGLGKGIVAEAQAKRQRQREVVRRQFQLDRDQASREFQVAQGERQYARQRDLLQDRQDFQREQGDLEYGRESRRVGSTFTNDQGEVVGIRGDGSTTVLGQAKQDPKNPKLYEVYDEQTGRKRKVAWDGKDFVPVGGMAARDADGSNVGKPLSDDRLRQWSMEQARADWQEGFMDLPEGMTPEQAIRQRADQLYRRARHGLAEPETRNSDRYQNRTQDNSSTASADEGEGINLWSTPGLIVEGGNALVQGARNLMGGGSQSQGAASADRPKSDAMTPKSERMPQSDDASGGALSQTAVQAPANSDAVKKMSIDDLRRYVEGASNEEIEGLPMAVRSEIVKRLRSER